MNCTTQYKLGLVGYPLEHSFSKAYFTKKFKRLNLSNFSYHNFSIPKIADIESVFQQENLLGLNVTIPYKESIIPYLDGLDVSAKEVGAVNTIRFYKTKKIGYNTDVLGFEYSLGQVVSANPSNNKALVLGTGGAAKAVIYVLKKMRIPYQIVSRKKQKADFTYHSLKEEASLANFSIIINTTPLGTFPKVSTCPDILYHQISSQHILIDLVYNPEETQFLSLGKKQNATTINGIPMLHQQAEAAWNIWTKNLNY